MSARSLARLRKAAGFTQENFVTAFATWADRLGIRASVSVRQLRRWESPDPPLPHPGQQAVLEAMLGVPLAEMGFIVPPERAHRASVTGHDGPVHRRQFVVDVGAVLGASVVRASRTGRRIGAADVRHVETGHPRYAIPFLRAAVDHLGPTYSRNAALYRARLAEVLMNVGDVEEACAEAVASARAAQGITSARLTDRLGAMASSAASFDSVATRECVEQLRMLGVSARRRSA